VARPRTPKGRARETAARLAAEYPGSAQELCALDFKNPFQLLVATVLSAQTTDEQVNLVTPRVFERYPTPADLGLADPAELETLIHSTGFFRSKAKSLMGLGAALDRRFGGEVPHTIDELDTLPGVGRKTANVVLSVGFGLPGLPVDTHVTRLTRRLGLTDSTDPVRIESDVDALLPRSEWGAFSLRLILHGRRVCIARQPRCADCVLADFCPSAQLFLQPDAAGGGRADPGRRRRPRRVAAATDLPPTGEPRHEGRVSPVVDLKAAGAPWQEGGVSPVVDLKAVGQPDQAAAADRHSVLKAVGEPGQAERAEGR
jgi:endonuclease-3